MSISGLCQICESREAKRQCNNCGALVCDADFEDATGVCVQCASGRGDVDPTGDPGGRDDDVDGAGDVHRV